MAKRRKRSKKWIYWLFTLILLVAAGVVCYLVWDAYFRDKSNQAGSQESSEVVENKDEKEDKTSENKEEAEGELKSESVEKKKVEQYDGSDPNEANDLSGVVTYAGVNNGKLMIRVNIDQYLTDGKCELTLTRGGATIYNSITNIVGSATTATCEGFDVPVSELGGGNVGINIKLKTDGRTGSIQGEANI